MNMFKDGDLLLQEVFMDIVKNLKEEKTFRNRMENSDHLVFHVCGID